MVCRPFVALALVAALLAACSKDEPVADPQVAASAPIPGVSLPPGTLVDLVPTPAEVPAGMVPILLGSGSRSLDVVASYSGEGQARTKAAASLRAHGFTEAYVAQYANQATGQVLSVLVTSFATAGGASQDYLDDQRGNSGESVPTEQVGDASSATVQPVPGSVTGELLIFRFLRGNHTWTMAYKAAPKADAAVVVGLAKTLLGRNAA